MPPRPPVIVTNHQELHLPNKMVDLEGTSNNNLSVFDRGLIKRQSKGKYQVAVKVRNNQYGNMIKNLKSIKIFLKGLNF